MTNAEIKDLLSTSKPEVYSIDPNHKSEISRSTLTNIDRQIKKALASKKNIKVLILVS